MTQQASNVQLTASVVQDGDWFVAQCIEVDVASQGRSTEEALSNLTEALELYYEDQPHLATKPAVAHVEVKPVDSR